MRTSIGLSKPRSKIWCHTDWYRSNCSHA